LRSRGVQRASPWHKLKKITDYIHAAIAENLRGGANLCADVT